MTTLIVAPSRAAYRPVADGRRWLQRALATVWIVDGLLQLQPFMFTGGFARMFVGISGGGNPGWIVASIHAAWMIVAANPVLANVGFAALQLGIGLAILWRPTLTIGLSVAIGWSVLVWWFGEDLGGLLAGNTSALAGAPGAALLYGVLALLLWPPREQRPHSFVAAGRVGPRSAKVIWLILWLGLAALNLQPANLGPNSVRSAVSGVADGQPAWIAALVNGFGRLSTHDGFVLTMTGAVLMALVGVGIFLPARWTRVTIVGALVTSAFIWLLGEALGAVFGGQATDVNSGPLLAIIAVAYWPVRSDARG
jgi:hypothetical protein